jgi:hypothetical protein
MRWYRLAELVIMVAAIGCTGPLSAQEGVGSAVGLTPSASGTVAGPLQLGASVYRDETVRTGEQGTLELKFLDDTHLGLAPSSSLKLDEFVYSVERKPDAVVINLARGAFRFATGNAAKKAYSIETPLASIGVRGTVLSIESLPERTRVTVNEGAVRVCTRGSSQQCLNTDASGKTIMVTPAGITTTDNPVIVALACTETSGSELCRPRYALGPAVNETGSIGPGLLASPPITVGEPPQSSPQ